MKVLRIRRDIHGVQPAEVGMGMDEAGVEAALALDLSTLMKIQLILGRAARLGLFINCGCSVALLNGRLR
jgi:hypothetical protein